MFPTTAEFIKFTEEKSKDPEGEQLIGEELQFLETFPKIWNSVTQPVVKGVKTAVRE